MSRKQFLTPQHAIVAQSMASTITSATYPIQVEDSVSVQLNFTGTPTGTFYMLGSLDNVNFIPMTLSPVPVASGAAGNILLDLYALSFPYIQIQYVPASGSGTLDAYISCKALGG